MNVLTSQDVALIGCCPCQPDACEEPRKDCQSKQVTQLAVGWSITNWRSAVGVFWAEGFEDTIPCPDYVRIYRHVLQEYSQTSTDPESEQYSQSLDVTVDPGAEYNVSGYPSPITQIGSTFSGGPIDSYSGGVYSGSVEEPDGEFTLTITGTITFSDPVDGAALLSEATASLEAEEWESGTVCASSASFITLTCRGAATEEPYSATFVATRYRVGIPEGDRWEATTAEWLAWEAGGSVGTEPLKTTHAAAHAAWVIDHAAWTAADPDERGDEPLEPTPRSTYELQWDEVFFPDEWEAWKALKDAFDAATAAHEIWTECEEDCGDEPIIPEDPGAEPTAPSLVASRSWTYAADEWSGWFEIAVPTEPGETRVVNMLVICYRSAALGQKPTAHGEVYEL